MDNEKKPRRLSSSEAKELGRKGGKASGEARRRRKALRENMELLLDLEVREPEDFNRLSSLGIPLGEIDNAMLLVAALFQKAAGGDVSAWKEIRDLVGEKEKESGEESEWGVVMLPPILPEPMPPGEEEGESDG